MSCNDVLSMVVIRSYEVLNRMNHKFEVMEGSFVVCLDVSRCVKDIRALVLEM